MKLAERVVREGNPICQHDMKTLPEVLMTMPPIHTAICKKCDRVTQWNQEPE